MALYKETSYDDWARRQRQSLQNSAQNLQQKQAGLQAAQNQKQKTTLESALSGLIGGLKERGSDILNTANNIGKTVVGAVGDTAQRIGLKSAQKDDSKRRNEIAKKYGFNSYSEAANSGNASQEFWNEIKDTNKQTKQKLESNKANLGTYGDVTKVNTNEAKGQALNTIDSVLGLLPGGLGVAANIAGGGLSGIGDEYKRAGREGNNFNWENAKNNAIVGAASGLAGSAGGAGMGRFASKAGTNALGKLAGTQLAKGIAGGAAAGAVGGGLGTYLNGGSLEDALLAAKEGAKAGGIGGGVMAGAMGLGGKALDKFRGRTGSAPTTDIEPVEATTVQKNRIDQPTTQRIEAEAPSTKRGIAITDLDAGEQEVNVRNGRPTENRGKYIDSVVRRADANLPEAQRPTLEQRFTRQFDSPLEQIIANGDMGDGIDILDTLKSSGVREPELAAIKSGARSYANDTNPFAAYGMTSRGDLPLLDRQEYYNDNMGKIGRAGNGGLTTEDVPSYMRDRLKNDAGKGRYSSADNESIMREVFGDNMSKEDMYRLYEDLADTTQASPYTSENFGYALSLDPELSARVQRAMLEQAAPTRKISIESALTQAQPVDITDMTTNYRKSTIPARQYEQTVNNIPEAETTANRPLASAPEQRIATQEPEVDYNTQIQRQKAQIQADKARRDAIGGVIEQYGTTRLNDRIEGLPNAIEDMLKLGLYDRAEIDNYAKQMTGKDSEIAKAIRKSLNDAGTTDTNLGITMEDVFASSGAEEAAQKKIKSFFDARQKKYATDNGTIKRADLYDLGKELEKEGYKKYDRGVRNQNTTDQAYGEALITLSEAAIGKATDGVDVSSNINLEKLIAIAPNNAEHVARMENLAQNAKTVQDLRSAMANATKLNLLKQAEEYNLNTYGQRVGGKGKAAVKAGKALITGRPATAIESTAEAILGSDKAKQRAIKANYEKAKNYQSQANGETPITTGKLAGIKEKVANIKDTGIVQGAKNIASGAAERINNATANLNNETLSNIGLNDGLTLGTYLTNQANRQIGYGQARDAQERMANAQALSQAQNDYNNALADYQTQEAAYNNQMAQLQSQNANSQLDRIASAMEMALNAGDLTAYGQLADLYSQAAKIQELRNPTSANSELTSAQKTKLNELDTSLNTLNQLKNAYEQAGGAKGLAGILSEGANKLTGGASNRNLAIYNDLKNSLGMAIVKNVVSVGGTEQDAKRYISALPSASDSPEQAAQKFAYLEEMLNNARQSIYSY